MARISLDEGLTIHVKNRIFDLWCFRHRWTTYSEMAVRVERDRTRLCDHSIYSDFLIWGCAGALIEKEREEDRDGTGLLAISRIGIHCYFILHMCFHMVSTFRYIRSIPAGLTVSLMAKETL